MASLVTNRGKYLILQGVFRNMGLPASFYMALADQTTTPTVDHNAFSEHTEVPAGNGYTSGGIALARNATDWDVLTEDDTNDRALVQAKDLVWTASGGNLPASGTGARWLDCLDDNVTIGSRQIFGSFDLASNRTVSDGQTLTIQNAEFRLT